MARVLNRLFLKYSTNNQRGQGLTEYAVVLCVIAVASIAVTSLFGGTLRMRISSLAGAVAGYNSSEIAKIDKSAKKAANDAVKKASNVKGNMTIDKDAVFDQQSY